jgi:hypothetical protein
MNGATARIAEALTASEWIAAVITQAATTPATVPAMRNEKSWHEAISVLPISCVCRDRSSLRGRGMDV